MAGAMESDKQPPPRSCIACCDDDTVTTLLKPCRRCSTDYCEDCVLDMFLCATEDHTRMPPSCCGLLQIHTAISYLTSDQATAYRAKFEEWISPVKTYCPSPTCAAFIPESHVPARVSTTAAPSIKSVLEDVLIKLRSTSSSRFFTGEQDITQLPGFTKTVKRPIDLSMIRKNLDRYQTIADLSADMRLLVANAIEINGADHPVSSAAHQLYYEFTGLISRVSDQLLTHITAAEESQKLFACPRCHLAICPTCKQVEHTGKPCDTTAADHEMAMLQTFGYKRCPRCKAGVKKMFGCSHMQCVCGAHWCYWCERSTSECDGACGDRDESEDDLEEDEEDFSEDEHLDDVEESAQLRLPTTAATTTLDQPPEAKSRVVNLDAGGDRRWAETDFDFGSEPGDEPFSQVWSCVHNFKAYEAPPDDGFNRGDFEKMECNRCFNRVVPGSRCAAGITSGTALRSEVCAGTDEAGNKEALECPWCNIVVCSSCRGKYN